MKFACSCGKVLSVKAEMAGRRGKCPACGAMMLVPSPPPPDDDLIEIQRSPGPSDGDECPVCGTTYGAGIAICVDCGVDLRTGERIQGLGPPAAIATIGRRPIRTGPSEDVFQRKPFSLLLLGILIHPMRTMDSITYYLGFPDILAKMSIGYVLSLFAVFLGGYFQAQRNAVKQTSEPPVELGLVNPAQECIEGGYISTVVPRPNPPVPGSETILEITVRDLEDLPFEGTVSVLLAGASFPTDPHDTSAVPREDARAEPTDQPGGFRLPIVFPATDLYVLEVVLHEDPPDEAPADPNPEGFDPDAEETAAPGTDVVHTHAMWVSEPMPELPTVLMAAGAGILALAAVLLAIVWLLIDTAILNIGGRIIGSGGSFLALLVVMAFLNSVVNWVELLAILMTPTLGSWVPWVLMIWRIFLYFLALMGVYNVGFGGAFLISMVAGIVKMWLMAGLVFSILAILL